MLKQKCVLRNTGSDRELFFKLFLLILVCLLTLGPLFQNIAATTTVSAAQDIRVFINDRLIQLEAKPIIQNGRTLVPMRGIFEALGAAVTWNANTRTAVGVRGNIEVRIPLGSRNPTVNGRIVSIDVAAASINGRTYIPLRFVGEALGDTVRWDGAASRINITREQHIGGTTPPAQPTTPPARPTTSPTVITYWAATSPETRADDPERAEAFLEVERKLNVDIRWIHIPPTTEHEQFSLMIAADNLPDVIFYSWLANFRPESAIEERIIIPLNDIITKYAPNLRRILETYPDEIARDMRTDAGYYYCFPYLRGIDMWDRIVNGIYLRRDWLNELGLRPPETISDWTITLRAFRDRKGADIPLGVDAGNLGFFSSAWGLNFTRFVIDGRRIVWSPIQNEYRSFLETMRNWVQEGLLQIEVADFFNVILRGEAGAWVTTPGQLIVQGRAVNPRFDKIPVSNPVLRRGDTPNFFPRWPFTGRGAAITSNADPKKHEAIARWLDYAYSEEGYMRDSFGVEGIHFNWVNGRVLPTDRILSPPNRLTTSQYLRRNFRPRNAPGPYLRGNQQVYLHPDANKRDPNFPFRREAVDAWARGNPGRTLPVLSFSPQEAEEMVVLREILDPYVTRMFNEFVSGTTSLAQFDDYVRELHRLGAARWIEIHQNALDRYWKR